VRVLALDVGERRIGLAISDPEGRVAVPLETLERGDEDADLRALADLVSREDVQVVVVGLPLSLDGTVGPQAERTQEFARRLATRLGRARPLEMWDERLSTVAAERSLLRPGPSGRRGQRQAGGRTSRQIGAGKRRAAERRQDARDALAATLILQAYLDSRRRPPASSAFAGGESASGGRGGPAPGGAQG
jgi:putative Holliday junction resolvase